MLRKITIGIAALVCTCALAVSQQWLPFPILGGASFCASSVNASCVQTIPAGPVMTGLETIPADTNASQGQNPQTVKVPISLLGAGPYQYSVPVTTNSITILPTTRQVLIEPAGTIAALTFVFPAATLLLDGQKLNICTTQIVTTLTTTAGSGTTVLNAPTALLVPVATGAASCPGWIYRAANTSWYRIQ